MSVGRLTDVGMKGAIENNVARVIAPDGAEACVFERNRGSLYICKFRLKRPPPIEGFGRQE